MGSGQRLVSRIVDMEFPIEEEQEKFEIIQKNEEVTKDLPAKTTTMPARSNFLNSLANHRDHMGRAALRFSNQNVRTQIVSSPLSLY